jgi:protein phosphatase
MLRVAEQYSGTDTGRQRRANEDALLARAPLFVVADGMGGAQAGEVASRTAVESFRRGLPDDHGDYERALSERITEANARIYELSRNNAAQAGMGTTLTALYVGEDRVSLAHVGDSRAYRLRDGQLVRLTEDHSLVDELIRQGRLTPAEAQDHPQRSVITRALGPEPTVQPDTYTHEARNGDVYLICSDGLTTMVSEDEVAQIISRSAGLREAGEALLRAANEAGGRDNITVILFRLEDVAPQGAAATGVLAESQPTNGEGADPAARVIEGGVQGGDGDGGATVATAESRVATAESQAALAPETAVEPRVVRRRTPRRPEQGHAARGRRRRRLRLRVAPFVALAVCGLVLAGLYLASQSVYFLGTNARGLVTVYTGLPYELPGGIDLYSAYYVSGVPATSISPARRNRLLDNSWRSQSDATGLVRSLELEELSGQ